MPQSGLNAERGNAKEVADMSAWSNPATVVWGHSQEAYLTSWIAWQQELARFFSARLDVDIAAQKSLTACRNWTDAGKLQQEWAAATMKDYLDESGRLLNIAMRCAQGMCGTAQTTETADLPVERAKVA
jgi:hypothetical protein